MDPNSERYRVCPNDGEPFMANHRNSKFCNDKCADEFHNLKKKDKEEKKIMIDVQHALKAAVPQGKVMSSSNNSVVVRSAQTNESIKRNIEILDKIKVDPITGSLFHLEKLFEIGVDFNAISGKSKLYNIDGSFNCHFVQIGYYRIFRVEFSIFLIIKTT